MGTSDGETSQTGGLEEEGSHVAADLRQEAEVKKMDDAFRIYRKEIEDSLTKRNLSNFVNLLPLL